MSEELKPLVFSISDLAYVDEIMVKKNFDNPHDHAVYKATEVDKVLAQKDFEIDRLKEFNAFLKQRISNGDVDCSTLLDDLEQKDKEIAKLKAAYSAKVEEPKNVERKCLAMAEDGDSRVREFVETKHDLLTTKYTKVLEESEYQYNAPHTFQVIRAQEENSEEHKGENLVLSEIHFQEGPIKECGVNGVCNEDLLVMVVRRLEGFQNSEFKCRENACAITKLEEALLWLRKRTMGRENRGVEGTHTV